MIDAVGREDAAQHADAAMERSDVSMERSLAILVTLEQAWRNENGTETPHKKPQQTINKTVFKHTLDAKNSVALFPLFGTDSQESYPPKQSIRIAVWQ
ncbi:MAG: hypothetical protein Q8M98_03490 [Candidatus Cloacimonadaceae bacterium]|nr:hypothetical protein [Candidatus Cloacimonadaceae bacterium]